MAVIHIGTATTLAAIPKADISNGNISYIWLNDYSRKMVYDSASTEATDTTNHPYYLRPLDYGAGPGVWIEDTSEHENGDPDVYSGNQIITGKLTSTNWAATEGSQYDLDLAKFRLGGSDVTAAGAVAGIFMGLDSGVYKFYVGDGSNKYFTFDGVKITWKAENSELDSSGNIICTGGDIAGSIITGKISTADANTYFDLANKILVFNGKSSFATTTDGIFMGLDSGVYKVNIGDADLYLKIWEGNAEFSGYLYSKYKIPSGLIIPLNTTSIPTGWERFTVLDGKHPVGAGSTYAVAASGGTSPVNLSRNTANAGAHTGTNTTTLTAAGSESASYSSNFEYSEENGLHLHTLTADYDRVWQQLLLIRATEGHQTYPANAVVLSKESTTPLAGLTICYNANKLLRSGDSITNGGGALTNKAITENGNHVHQVDTIRTTDSYTYPLNAYAGIHSHTYTISLTNETLKRAYLTAWTKTAGFESTTGIIAMWEGTTAPEGWHLCDGTDGYIDLRDYFIILSDTTNAGNTHNESNQIYIECTITTAAWTHGHQGSDSTGAHRTGAKHVSEDHSHNHSITAAAWHNYTPLYYALTFIQKI